MPELQQYAKPALTLGVQLVPQSNRSGNHRADLIVASIIIFWDSPMSFASQSMWDDVHASGT
jgi:hypothetical protein